MAYTLPMFYLIVWAIENYEQRQKEKNGCFEFDFTKGMQSKILTVHLQFDSMT